MQGDLKILFIRILSVKVTCGEEIKNSKLSYFVSPNFPTLVPKDMSTCSVQIKPVSSDISQIRLDFLHFSMVRSLKCFS